MDWLNEGCSNRVIATLIKDSTTRKILFDNNLEFIAPDSITVEVDKYKDEIIEKAGISEKEYSILLSIMAARDKAKN